MKTTTYLLSAMLLGAATLTHAADAPVPAASLPTLVFLLSEAREGGKPNVTYYYSLSRGGTPVVPLFSSNEAAKSFLATLPESQARKLTPVASTKSFVETAITKGTAVWLDPKNAVEGGTPVAAEAPAAAAPDDNEELRRLFNEDQADRQPAYEGKTIDLLVMSRRDDEREKRVKELYAADQLRTGADYYHAGMVLQHALTPDDYLLCHDLCVVAIAKGEPRAKWLAAASLYRFLVSVGRPQRFGTQYGTARPGFPIRMSPVDPTVTDRLRGEFGVAPLAELKQREAKMDTLFGQRKQPNQAPAPAANAAPPPAAGEPRQP